MTVALLDQVIRAANAEAGYKTLQRYVLFLHFSFDIFFKMKRDGVINNVKFIQLNMIGNRCKLPDNVLSIGKVGIQVGRRIITAIPDGSISLDPANVGQGFTSVNFPTTDLFSFLQISSIYFQDGGIGTRDGSYLAPRYKKVHGSRDVIFDRGVDGAQVYFEVIENGINPGSNTLVPQDAVLPMKSYIQYRHARFKYGAAANETQAALAEHDDELEEAVASQSNLTGNVIQNTLSLRIQSY